MKGGITFEDFDAASVRLDDYIRGKTDEDQASAFEEDLFERALAGSAPELVFRASLGATLRAMSRRGTIDVWLTSADVERLRSDPNLRVFFYNLNLEKPVPPEIPAGADLIVTRIPVGLRGVDRLEAEILSVDGHLLKKMPDIAFDPADDAVYACCEVELARVASAARTTTQVWAVSKAKRELLLEIPSF